VTIYIFLRLFLFFFQVFLIIINRHHHNHNHNNTYPSVFVVSPLRLASNPPPYKLFLLPYRALLALCCSPEQSPPPFPSVNPPVLATSKAALSPITVRGLAHTVGLTLDIQRSTQSIYLVPLLLSPTFRPFSFPPPPTPNSHPLPSYYCTYYCRNHHLSHPLFLSNYPPASSLHQSIQSLVPLSIKNSFPPTFPELYCAVNTR
jgi:hypothetical protein